ncbi:3-methylcrotonyl-CoA carboxylase [Zhengella mangrovi]|uniref:3-methylcrotonyl-CoA carboxylase n=1 Tax=Zhengella mangrovi TaxID=1982044 RepID=A0A2G1QKF4_9HYPH|nr:acetyl-CoA carboxylase biotin carboxylase subunit [Zhengella mangrovi]PHP65941.1 3-methylcrotonyl-CoA carboxylase [Zhengella mangrovi]
MLKPFTSLLIANRGEIACRIIRTARDLGLRTIAVHSDADDRAPHVRLADDAVRIGPGPAGESYLDAAAILEAARLSGAGAIHPGYGFLSENADFARAVEAAGLVFVGPPAEAIAVMGDKAGAKRAMIAAGVPCVPGYQDADQSEATLAREAERIGYPVMAKAAAGGGGRGMRLVETPDALPDALALARNEAVSAFGSGQLILEKAILRPRHVEIQVFADARGNCIHLGERDCSVQRRHQKVVEEAPCPVMTEGLRERMGAAAVAAASAVGYCGAGTVEFLLDDEGRFHFLEMNTRLQVEHPVTEMVTGHDLVAWQIRVAMGEPLPVTQDEVRLSGHAIEVRLYAEDPACDFLPVTGQVALWSPAEGPGIRIDAGIAGGQEITPFYDPMLAKLIAWGETREAARTRLLAALERTAILGLTTNAGFLAGILDAPAFVAGEATTAFIAETWPDGMAETPPGSRLLAAGAALVLQGAMHEALDASPMTDDSLCGFASDGGLPVPVDLIESGRVHALQAEAVGPRGWMVTGPDWCHEIRLEEPGPGWRGLTIDGRGAAVAEAPDGNGGMHVQIGTQSVALARHRPWEPSAGEAGSGRVAAPMPGLVVSLAVGPGDRVVSGQVLAVMEAMKMQHQLRADIDGIVADVAVSVGQQVAAGSPVVTITEEEP